MESRRVVKKDQIAEPIALLSGEEALQEQKVKEQQVGASLVEYAILLILVMVVGVVVIRSVGDKVSNQFSTFGSQL